MIGEIVGSYRVAGVLGRGGMGVVYVADHPLLGRRAVVKMLLPHLSRKTEMIERFFTEARASTLVKHPGIVDIFDFGYHASGSAYIVMEHLEGETLAQHLRRSGCVPFATARQVGLQIASALGAAHERGIVHRDLKPDNLFLEHDPAVAGGRRTKVLDFGVAKLTGGAAGGWQTELGAQLGTPLYMAPEQCESAADVDARADIYALGCILFELVAGRPPFTGNSLGELATAHLSAPVPDVAALVPGIPERLRVTITRCLAKAPIDRPQTMGEVAAMLRDANPRSLGGADAFAPTCPQLSNAAPRSRRSRGVVVGAALAACIATLALAIGSAPRPARAVGPALVLSVPRRAPVVEPRPEPERKRELDPGPVAEVVAQPVVSPPAKTSAPKVRARRVAASAPGDSLLEPEL